MQVTEGRTRQGHSAPSPPAPAPAPRHPHRQARVLRRLLAAGASAGSRSGSSRHLVLRGSSRRRSLSAPHTSRPAPPMHTSAFSTAPRRPREHPARPQAAPAHRPGQPVRVPHRGRQQCRSRRTNTLLLHVQQLPPRIPPRRDFAPGRRSQRTRPSAHTTALLAVPLPSALGSRSRPTLGRYARGRTRGTLFQGGRTRATGSKSKHVRTR